MYLARKAYAQAFSSVTLVASEETGEEDREVQEEVAAGHVWVLCNGVKDARWDVNQGSQDGKWWAESRRCDQWKKSKKNNKKSAKCCTR